MFKKISPASRRLLPLYIAAFLFGIPFWYAIEKLFMMDIGFNTASIGLTVAIMSAVMIIVEAPAGILADRWSRKGVIFISGLALLVSVVLGALSFNEPLYILSNVFWGIYFALYNGSFDAIIYDTVVEEHGDSEKFQDYLGRFRAVEGASFVIGALLGGLIADVISMRYTFILSLPFVILSLLAVLKFREPQLHKSEAAEPVERHVRQTFAAVFNNPHLLPVIVSIVGFGIILEMLLELSQLWFIAIAAPVVLYGIFSAVVYSSWTVGGLIIVWLKSKLASVMLISTIMICILGLIFTRDYIFVLLSQFVLATSLVALGIILAQRLHDELPSRLRAGSASVVNTLSRSILIPVSLIFTLIAQNFDVFRATYILLGFAIMSLISYNLITPLKKVSLKKAAQLKI